MSGWNRLPGEGQRWREHRAAFGPAGSWVPDRRCRRSDLLVHAGGRRRPAASGPPWGSDSCAGLAHPSCRHGGLQGRRPAVAGTEDPGLIREMNETPGSTAALAATRLAGRERDVAAVCRRTRLCWAKRRPTGADAWRDPQAQREFLARIDTYRDEGPPPAEQRTSREEIRTQFGV
jgi:hypothetical protein